MMNGHEPKGSDRRLPWQQTRAHRHERPPERQGGKHAGSADIAGRDQQPGGVPPEINRRFSRKKRARPEEI